MMIMQVAVDAVMVGDRRREDLGDIAGLAKSIERFGLLHPIIVDDGARLVAGGRRLAAVKSLGWKTIEARDFGALTEAELRELELEENLRRKDLTPEERSRNLVALAETAKEIAETCADSAQVSKPTRGPARTPGSLRDVSQRIGVPEATIRAAQQHVTAAEKYPELKASDIPQAEAIQVAAKLDALPEPERAPVLTLLRQTERAPADIRRAAREQVRRSPSELAGLTVQEEAAQRVASGVAASVEQAVQDIIREGLPKPAAIVAMEQQAAQSPEMQRVAFYDQFSSALRAADRQWLSLDPQTCADVTDEFEHVDVNRICDAAIAWIEQYRRHRSRGLRVVGGHR